MRRLPHENIHKRSARLATHFNIIKPDGDGPFPTIIMMHGCGRSDVPQMPYALAAKEKGFASIIVDSFAPRGISEIEAAATVCTGISLRGSERTGDFIGALHWALEQDWVKKDDIHGIGWSHGGWTIMDSIARENDIAKLADIKIDSPEILSNLKSAFCIYPWCGPGSYSHSKGWGRKIPAHVIICGQDFVTGDALARQTISKLQDDGIDIDFTFFARGTHSFDEFESFHPAQKYDPQLTEEAINIFLNFVEKHSSI